MTKKKQLKKNRPVDIDIIKYRLPINGIVSILHRISGLLMIFFVGALLYILDQSLSSPQLFNETKSIFQGLFTKVMLWIICTTITYHSLGGIRHIIMDKGYIQEKNTGTISGIIIMLATVVISIMFGVKIWI